MSRALETVKYTGLSGTQNGAVFLLNGGTYQATAVAAAWNSGSAELFQLAADQTTWLSVTDQITRDGGDTFFLPPGNYRWSIVSATGVTVCVSRIPGE